MRKIKNPVLFEYFFFAVCGLRVTLGQSPSSPCPSVFSYQQDAGRWYGYITGRSSVYGEVIKTVIEMEYDGILRAGEIKNIDRLTPDDEMRDVVARGGPIRYRLDINVNPLPRVIEIEFNGRIVCDSPRDESRQRNLYVARREHKLYPNGRPDSTVSIPQPNPGPRLRPNPGPTPRPTPTLWPRPNPQITPNSLPSTLSRSTSTEKNLATEKNTAWTQQCSKRDEVNTLITGGQSTKKGEWPWHVAIYHIEHMDTSSSISYKCGGSLISASHVLTTAHCFTDKLTNRPIAKSRINIFLGTHNIRSLSVGVQFKLVERLEIHPEYNPQTQYKDIAVLKLSSPVEFTVAVRPVCLWPEDEVDPNNVVGKNGSVVGWGYDEFGLLADELMLAEMPVVSELTCIRSHDFFYNKYTNNFTFCAGLLQDTSLCNGDSGGGMVFKHRSSAGTEVWFLRGIVSLRLVTDKPCDPSQYVIFTDVAKYLDWIKDSVSRD